MLLLLKGKHEVLEQNFQLNLNAVCKYNTFILPMSPSDLVQWHVGRKKSHMYGEQPARLDFNALLSDSDSVSGQFCSMSIKPCHSTSLTWTVILHEWLVFFNIYYIKFCMHPQGQCLWCWEIQCLWGTKQKHG